MLKRLFISFVFVCGPAAGIAVCAQDTVMVRKDSLLLASRQAVEDTVVTEPMVSHIAFKGIAVDGTSAAFGAELEKNGFRKTGNGMYSGTFAGVKNAVISLSEFCGNVWLVGVKFPAYQTWNQVKDEYLKFKSRLGWKYVTSPSVVREALSQKYREGSGQEAWGFENGTSSYSSTFEFMEGEIILYVLYDKPSGGMRVCIDYVDRLNAILKEEQDILDL